MFKCEICGKECKSAAGLGSHMQAHTKPTIKKFTCQICGRTIGGHATGLHIKSHGMTTREYYDIYLKKPEEGICINCGKPTNFQSMFYGYAKCCSQTCQKQHVWDNLSEEDRNKSIEKNSKSVSNAWQSKPLEKQIEHQRKAHQYNKKSSCEKYIADSIASFYHGEIWYNSRKVISPYEIDIYLPELKLAIEVNGIFYHSVTFNKDKDYHLCKSLKCRDKGIRLIHIYEFEDINEQLSLLKDLINGQDDYKNDFNKNNLLLEIPEPELIYTDRRGNCIYGAGKLL